MHNAAGGSKTCHLSKCKNLQLNESVSGGRDRSCIGFTVDYGMRARPRKFSVTVQAHLKADER